MLRPPDVNEILARNGAVFDWCIRSAQRQYDGGRLEKAAEWCAVASFLAAGPGWFGYLADPDLEEILLKIGAQIPPVQRPSCPSRHRRWLHVMTDVWYWGGMVENVKKWLRFTENHALNSVVVLDQRNPGWLKPLGDVVEQTGGRVYVIHRAVPQIQKALELRRLAAEQADTVVLHTRVDDVVPTMAFGLPGGPPIFRMNHDDHLFWVGAAVADLVLNFRELGERWTRAHRGLDRSTLLPLPMATLPERADTPARRTNARRRLGIADDAVVLLAVGSAYKFRPVGDWDFVRAAEAILRHCPKAHILAAGIRTDGRWREVADAFDGRLQAVGVQADMTDCHAASDIGIGSIPFPSQTAILEIALLGRPCVLTPRDVPLGINDPAFDVALQPSTMDEYVEMSARLVERPDLREEQGRVLAQSVREHHGREGWLKRWDSLCDAGPSSHRVYPLFSATPMPADACNFWSEFVGLAEQDVFRHVHYSIITERRRLWPSPDRELLRTTKPLFSAVSCGTIAFCLRKLRIRLGALKSSLQSCRS